MTYCIRTLLLTAALSLSAATLHAADWLARIADNVRVARLSIPGTHDAATGDGFVDSDTLLASRIACTQQLPLARQWAAGIRAFDLRPDVMTDSLGHQSLHIYHGEFATRASFAGVLAMLRDSLRAHPTEFAVIVMRHESSPHRESSHWQEMMDYQLALNSDLLVDFRPDITVGQLRGRILLLSRDTYNELPRGGYISGWRHDADIDPSRPATIRGCAREGRLLVQDFYDMSGDGGLPTKLAAIERLFRLTRDRELLRAHPDTWFINHTSGYLFTTSEYGGEPVSTTEGYRANAAETNRRLISLINSLDNSRKPTARTGIVMMDFGGTDRSGAYDVMGLALLKAIINSNFR